MTSVSQLNHRTNGARTYQQSRTPRVSLIARADMDLAGEVKWYDEKKRFGFIVPDEGTQDVFVHASVLKQYGIRDMDVVKGVRVAFKANTKPGLRPEATAISLL